MSSSMSAPSNAGVSFSASLSSDSNQQEATHGDVRVSSASQRSSASSTGSRSLPTTGDGSRPRRLSYLDESHGSRRLSYMDAQCFLHNSSETAGFAGGVRKTMRQSMRAADQITQAAAGGQANGGAGMFADMDAMIDKVHANIDVPDYDVCDYYYDTGIVQAIARSRPFGSISLAVISINAGWIGLDAECNDKDMSYTGQYSPSCPAYPQDKMFWTFGENLFCVFFTVELLIRFGAFKRKISAVKDNWFKFDSVLVFFMVLETWCLPIFTGGNSDAMSDFAMLRMLRLLRLTRMVRLMRSVPELVTLVKGMAIAMRSVSSILLLLLIFMYIFSIIFKSQLVDTEVPGLKAYFEGIPRSMWTLFLHGCLLDAINLPANLLVKEGPIMVIIFIVFVLLSSLMLLNMLIGVLCAVVTAVAHQEKELVLVTWVKARLIAVLEELDEDGNGTISKSEFLQLVNVPDAVLALEESYSWLLRRGLATTYAETDSNIVTEIYRRVAARAAKRGKSELFDGDSTAVKFRLGKAQGERVLQEWFRAVPSLVKALATDTAPDKLEKKLRSISFVGELTAKEMFVHLSYVNPSVADTIRHIAVGPGARDGALLVLDGDLPGSIWPATRKDWFIASVATTAGGSGQAQDGAGLPDARTACNTLPKAKKANLGGNGPEGLEAMRRIEKLQAWALKNVPRLDEACRAYRTNASHRLDPLRNCKLTREHLLDLADVEVMCCYYKNYIKLRQRFGDAPFTGAGPRGWERREV